jgi:ribosomal-protein-alanine N-acetyltransferase
VVRGHLIGDPRLLTTERLTLRPVAHVDVQPLHDLWSSTGVRRFLWDDRDIPLDRTREAIELSGRLFAERQFGLWCARPSDAPDVLAGFGALWPFREPPELEVLYGVAEPLWGKGYATEIARAVAAYCFEYLEMNELRASTDAGNVASVRVLEKLGFSFVCRAIVDGLDTLFFELPRSRASFARSTLASNEHPRSRSDV